VETLCLKILVLIGTIIIVKTHYVIGLRCVSLRWPILLCDSAVVDSFVITVSFYLNIYGSSPPVFFCRNDQLISVENVSDIIYL